MPFPTSPQLGKGGKVLINFTDGTKLTSFVMTKQAAYTYKGTLIENLIYLLGTGKTLLNLRPAVEPRIDIDAIVTGLDVVPTSNNDEVSVGAGSIKKDGVEAAVISGLVSSITRPAATQAAWIAITVNKTTGAKTFIKGIDTTAGTGKAGLLDTYGSGAGQRPLIPTTDLLVALIQLENGAAPIAASEIFFYDRETIVDAEILPNVGGVKISSVLVACHAGALAREVKFTGYYLDEVLSEIGTAKEWSLEAQSNEVTETTFGRTIKQTEVSGWTFSFNQLAADRKVVDILLSRQGHCAVRLMYPNGGYWQGVGSCTASFGAAPGAFANIDVSGSLADDPVMV